MEISFDEDLTEQLPTLTADRDPAWGTHVLDVNVALGDLVDLVGRQAAAWAERGGPSEPGTG